MEKNIWPHESILWLIFELFGDISNSASAELPVEKLKTSCASTGLPVEKSSWAGTGRYVEKSSCASAGLPVEKSNWAGTGRYDPKFEGDEHF